MTFTSLTLPGLVVIDPQVFPDDRGVFFETYHQQKFAEHGITDSFVQDNHSVSVKNTIRGLHYQLPPHAQSKLVRVIAGEVYDVAVDLRKDSPTFKQWYGIHLSAENKKMLYVPTGFAHGFCVLSDQAEFVYKCGALYNRESEAGLRWDDPEINIQWPIQVDQALISTKDQQLPLFTHITAAQLF